MKRFLSFCRGDVGRTLATTVGSPSVHRRGNLLKPLFLAMLFLIAGIGNVWAAEGDVVYTLNTAASSIPIATDNSYGNYADATNNWKVTCGAKQSDGLWLGSNSNKKAKMILSNGSYSEGSAIATALDIQASATYYAAIIGTSELENVGKVTLTYTTPGGTAPSEAWICYSTNSGTSWTIAKKVTTLSTSGTDFEFESTIASARYAFVIHSTGYCQFKVPVLTFYEGATGGGDTPTPVTVKTLKSIAVSGQTTTYDQFASFSFDGTCTATYSVTIDDVEQDDEEKEVTPTSVTSPDMSTTGVKEVTVSFTDDNVTKTAKYSITVNEHVVTPGEYDITPNNAFWGTSYNGNPPSGSPTSFSASKYDITVQYNKGSGGYLYINDSQTRIYPKNTLAISVPTGYNITSIVFTGTFNNTMTPSVGEYTSSTKTWEGKANSVTFTGGGSSGNNQCSKITVTYEAIAPEVTVDPEELSFTAKQNIAVDGKTFTLTGANLTSGLTLAASAGFNVSPESITAADAMAQGGVEVTVTPATPTATTTPVEGTVTISGGGLTSDVVVNLSMAVTPTYAVALAVNDNAMGSATLNGGTASIYVTDDEEIALVATPESGHEFVNWTVSDENIILNNANAASTTAMAGAAGTITANFQAQACTGLAAPVLDEVTTTYQSATIAWLAVDNADGYVLNIVKHEGGVAVLTDEVIEAPTVSFEKTGLEANTQYDYTVMAVGDGTSYCEESNPTLAGSFTTIDYPAATLSLVENGGTPYNWGSNLKMNDVIALPTELAGLGCTGKVLVGWSSVAVAETDDEPTSNYWAKGADYTITSTADKLYAVLATQTGGGANDVVFNAGDYATANSWENGVAYNATIDGISFTYGGGGNNGKYYTSDKSWRFYNGGSLTISGTGITGVSSTPSVTFTENNGTYSTSFTATVKITEITVSVSTLATYEAYTTSCTAALPVLDAPTFPVEEGVFYENTDITISAADGASIYYTLDGTTPSSTNGTLYEGAITLNAYGTYNFKAIAVQAGHEDSEVAEATYYFGMTFASVSDLYTYLETNSLTSMDNVKVTGLVSRITTAWDGTKGYLTYYISDNGVAENDLQMFRGAGEGASALAVGDQVTVTGNYTLYQSTTHEFGAGNTIVARTAGAHDSYEIAGNLGKTNFAAGEKWLDSYLSGLSVNDVYNTGYKAAVSGVSFSADKTDQTALESTDTQITVTATKDQAELATKDFAITVSSATLVSIALKDGYKTEYYVGDELVKPTVIATLSDYSQIEETATACTGQNMSVAGVYTVNVAFTYGDNTIDEGVEYQITVKAIYNNDDAPHTVAEALDIIGQHHNTSTASSDSIVVAGIVSRLDGNYVNTYWISDDGQTNNELEVYRGTYLGKVNFTTNNQLHVGDEVVVKGKVKTYSNTKEFDTGSRLVSLARTPNFEVADVAEALEINISEDLGVEDLTITKEGEGAVTLVSSDETKVSIVNGKLHAVAAAENVEITANLAANGIYKANSDVFHVSVIAERTRYTVSFDANGGTGTDPVIANQLPGATVDLPENPYSKENSAFDAWVVNDGAVEITDGHFTMPEGNVTIKATWNEVETTRIIFNVNGNTNVIAAVDAPQTVKYDITQTAEAISGYEFYGWTVAPETADITAAIDTIKSYTPQAGEDADKVLYAVFKRSVVGNNKTDVITVADLTATGTSYEDFADVQKVSTAKYAGTTAKSGSRIQFNKATQGGIYSSVSGGELVSVSVDMASATSKLAVYGSNVGFTSPMSFSGQTGAELIEEFSSVTTKTVTPATSYKYVGVGPSSDGVKYVNSITFVWKLTEVYYTTAPAAVYDVTYNLGSDPVGAWKANEGCDDAKVKAGQTYNICTDEPVRDGYKFNGWTVGGSAVSGTISINGNTTITADWIEKQNVALTYSDGAEDPAISAAGDIEEGTVITLPAVGTGDGQINFSKSGYDFKGWKYNGKNYKAGASFTMPAEAVQFVAQWKKQNLEKLTLVTNASQLVAGSKVVFANQEASAVAGNSAKVTDSYLESIAATFSEDKSLINTVGSGIKMTLVQVADGWAFEYNGKYLAPYSGNKMAWYATPTAWTIVVDENNNAKIENGENYAMRYNKSQNQQRFAAYGKTSCEPIQLYAEYAAVSEAGTTNVSALGNMDDEIIVASGEGVILNVDVAPDSVSYVAKNGATIVISATNEATKTTKSVIADEKSKIEVTAPTTVNQTFSVAATMGGGVSGQIAGSNLVTIAQSTDAYFDITLGDNANPEHWHAIAVPFPVDVINGIYDAVTGNKLENEVNYAIMEYHGNLRAQGLYGWKKIRTTLMPGVFYLMTVDGNTKTFRFKMSGTTLPTATSLALQLFAQTSGDDKDGGWNGVANPTLQHGTVNQTVTVLNPSTYTYEDKDAGEMNFVVGTPFFIQADATIVTEGMEMGAADGSKDYYAPKRVSEKSVENIKVFFGNEEYKDKLTISANEEALNEYQIGKDLVKMTMTSTPKVAQIFGNAYNAQMCRIYAPMSNDKAEYSLTLYAPNTGEYTISAPAMENADLYLTKDGAIIWNLSTSEYTNDFEKGNNEGYGLLLVKKIAGMATGCESIEAQKTGVQKIVIDDKVFILRAGQMYDVTGKMVK